MRTMTLFVLALVASGSAYALATSQSAAQERAGASSSRETPEEVIVRGRRLAELRLQVRDTRERAYAIFNEINSSDDFDVHCRDERKYHSRAKKRVCRAQFENRISGDAAKEYMATLLWNCPPSPGGFVDTQACMFSGPGQTARLAAQRVEGQAPPMRDRMEDEILRLARTDLRFGHAILDFFEATRQYDEARGRSEEEE
jgi:hypothetical protein